MIDSSKLRKWLNDLPPDQQLDYMVEENPHGTDVYLLAVNSKEHNIEDKIQL